MTSEFAIGWELMFHSVEKDIKSKEDVMLVIVHWVLIKSKFRCIGLGDDSTFTVDEPGSELLPSGWSTKPNYAIKYSLDNQLFILRGLVVENDFVLNLVRVADKNVSTMVVKPSEVVKVTSGPLENMVPTSAELFCSVKCEMISPQIKTSSKEVMTQTPANVRPPGTHQPNLLGRSPSADIESQRGRYADPFGVGRSDLDPFGRPGQGMIFDPFSHTPRHPLDPGQGVPGGLPRGAVPPGARFDPFGPPDPDPRPMRRRFPPDSDELPPPGYDDMFM